MRISLLLTILMIGTGIFSIKLAYANSPNTPCGLLATAFPQALTSSSSPLTTGETPASIACVYGLTPNAPGCKIGNPSLTPPSGGWGVIAVTDGYDDPFALQELNEFSTKLGLPTMTACTSVNTPSSTPCFATVYSNGTQPSLPDTSTPQGLVDLREHAIDIEMAHAMAPMASIVMVEAPTFGEFDTPSIFSAVQCASQIVSAMGGGQVSNSWGTAKTTDNVHEYPSETSNDAYFQTSGIVYFASSGDRLAPANYPAASPYVVSVGGTSFVRDNKGNFVKEIAWIKGDGSGSSGGPSVYEPRPSFQNSVMKIVGTRRGSPDIAAIGDNIDFYYQDCNSCTGPNCNTTPNCGSCTPTTCSVTPSWVAAGGTSFASPIMAGIINAAGSRASSSQKELSIIYDGALKNYASYWHDIIQGNNGYPTLHGYDFVTGLGSPKGYLGK